LKCQDIENKLLNKVFYLVQISKDNTKKQDKISMNHFPISLYIKNF